MVETAGNCKLPPSFAGRLTAATVARLRADLRPVPHAAYALTWLRGPKCVASSSTPDRIRASLETAGLARFFDYVFSAADVPNGKPAPDLFLHAAGRMGVEPRDCIVVEDSPAGVSAAKAAGMNAIGFVGGSHAHGELGGALIAAGPSSPICATSKGRSLHCAGGSARVTAGVAPAFLRTSPASSRSCRRPHRIRRRRHRPQAPSPAAVGSSAPPRCRQIERASDRAR